MSGDPQVLFRNRRPGETLSIAGYEASGGYQGLSRALRMSPAEVRELVKASGLRGRGGAGFPTGVKWSFFPEAPGEKYLLANGDEMEPGTYKDHQLLLADPHQLVEGMAIAAWAMQIPVGYVFLRYAYEEVAQRVERAIAEAEAKGYLGDNLLGSGFSFVLHVHRSAGRYILGEETALINGLEGRRPNPRSKPPFPAQRGLFGKPTNVNNIETYANVPHILVNGAEWYKSLSRTADGAGTLLVGLSGHLERTACFELPMGIPLREVIERCGGGVRGGRAFKACLPGGASTPYLTAARLDTPLDHVHLEQAGSRLGTAGVTVFAEGTCMVAATLNLARFFARESCGWCTPCRDGLATVVWLLEEIEAGRGHRELLDMYADQIRNIRGRSFCALAEGAMGPVGALLEHFGDELEEHVKRGRCPFKD